MSTGPQRADGAFTSCLIGLPGRSVVHHPYGRKQTNKCCCCPPSILALCGLSATGGFRLPSFKVRREQPRAAGGAPGVDPSRLIIILDQPPLHLKSLREDLSRSSFCSYLLFFHEKAQRHICTHTWPESPSPVPSSTGGLPVRKLSRANKDRSQTPRQKSDLTAEAAEQLEGGLLLLYLVDVARPRGHTWDSLLAWKGSTYSPQTLAFQTFSVVHEELRGYVRAPTEPLYRTNAKVMKYLYELCLLAHTKVANI